MMQPPGGAAVLDRSAQSPPAPARPVRRALAQVREADPLAALARRDAELAEMIQADPALAELFRSGRRRVWRNPEAGYCGPARLVYRPRNPAQTTGLELVDWFAGCGGSSQGASVVPYIQVAAAANHNHEALTSHALNHPDCEHWEGDLAKAQIWTMRGGHLFWASPVCPPWSNARGVRRDFDAASQQLTLFGGEEEQDEKTELTRRARALIEEVPRFLEEMLRRGRPVLAGVMENVKECRQWAHWDAFVARIRAMGYRTYVIALNSKFANGPRCGQVAQSRDRLYLAFIREEIGREPDWNKWLRPLAWCPRCEQDVRGVQTFKKIGLDMGAYGAQYVYRCPQAACRGQQVEPYTSPAASVIDWHTPGTPIEGREKMSPKTLARVAVGIRKFSQPLIVPAGGSWASDARPVREPLATLTTRESGALAVPPMLIPCEGRPGKEPMPVDGPLRTLTTRAETGLAHLADPFMVSLRGGGARKAAHRIGEPLTTVTASGNHHGLVTPSLLVPYYGTGVAAGVDQPVGTLTTRDRFALTGASIDLEMAKVDWAAAEFDRLAAQIEALPEKQRRALRRPYDMKAVEVAAASGIGRILFRMLMPEEIRAGMGFPDGYRLVGDKRAKVRQLGNAVTPAAAEILLSALVEAITGEEFELELAA